MYINFWYAAERSDRLADRPLKVRMLGLDFVLFRDAAGKAHCLSNTCVHRGGSLGDGKVVGDCVQCPYHGWQFDGEGRCRRIPSLGAQARIPGRARVDAYPVVERYGLVFAFLGDLAEDQRPPIMDIPEHGQSGWYASVEEHVAEIDYRRSIENGLDPAHNEFVHTTHGRSGTEEDARVPELRIEETAWGGGFITTYYSPPLTDDRMKQASGRSQDAVVEAGTFHHGPSCMTTYIHPTPEISIHQNVFKTPIDAAHVRTFLVQTRNFLQGAAHDARFTERNRFVREQDATVLSGLAPFQAPESSRHEFMVPADRAVLRYRERLDDWQSRGWRIDSSLLAVRSRQEALAIPSPARRASPKGFVLDTVPLCAGKPAADCSASDVA